MRYIPLFFFPLRSLLALYQGSPILPEMPEDNLFLGEKNPLSLKATYLADAVLDRSMTASSNMHSVSQGAEVALGFTDRAEAYILLGGFKETIITHKGSSQSKWKVGSSFGGEIGARMVGIFWGETKIGFDAKYFYGYPHLEAISVGSSSSKATAHSWQSQWQVGVGLSQKIGYFIPYVGIDFSRFVMHFTKVRSSMHRENLHLENTSPWGFVIGIGICGQKGALVNVEARFFNEYAFSAAAGLRF